MMILYGSSISGNCLKPKWVADCLGVPYVWTEVDVFNGETRTAEFLALNPAGQVPVAKFDDGRLLAQSNAIMLYLAEGSRLIPNDAFSRAKMYEWLFWEQYNHEPAIAVRIARKHYLKQREEELDPSLLTRGHAALKRMELHLADHDYFAADALSLADVALVAYTRKAPMGGYDLSGYRSTRAWISRIESELRIGPVEYA